MKYLLDTNACVALINGAPELVRRRMAGAVSAGNEILVSSIVLFELCYGIAKSSRPDFNRKRLTAFLAGPVSRLSFDDEDANHAAIIRSVLETSGKPIGAYDFLIAGQAVNRGLIVVTANVREFSRVKGLMWQDWAKA